MNSRINERNNLFEEIYSTLSSGYVRENLRYASSLLYYYLASMRYLRLYRQRGGDMRKEDQQDQVADTASEQDVIEALIH